MGEPENTRAENDSLRVQLSELNNRSRWYTARLWHIPFAYFGILGVTVAQFMAEGRSYLPYVLILFGLFGCFVLWHMWEIWDGEKRAVEELQITEGLLELPQTAQYKKNYVLSLFIALLLGVLACLGFGLYLLKCS